MGSRLRRTASPKSWGRQHSALGGTWRPSGSVSPESAKVQVGAEPATDGLQPGLAPIERAVITAVEVGEVLGVGRTKVHELNGRGKLPAPVTVGARGLRWVRLEIEAWLLHGAPPRASWERLWPRVRREVLRR